MIKSVRMADAKSGKSRAQSAMEYLITYGWAIIIIAIVLTALFELGLFTPPVSTACVFPADFGCVSSTLYSGNSTVVINVQQNTASSVNITAYGCNAQGTVTNMHAVANGIVLNIGGNTTFGVQCYNNGTVVSLSAGQIFKGYVLINYTDINSGFRHTVVGQLIAKTV